MEALRLVTVMAASLMLSGCYASHARSEDPIVRDSGSPRDGSPRDGAPRDGSPPPDASVPDGAPADSSSSDALLPPEPDPDLGTGSRPSEYPEAEDWNDPPRIAAWDPCCTLAEPVRVMEEEEGIHFSLRDVVQVAAGPGRWAVLVSRLDDEDGTIDPRALILSLDADGTRIDTKLLELPMLGGGELLWAEGRWAVATESLDGDVAHVRAQLFDREFRAATPVLELGPTHPSSLALVRLTHLDRWVALRNEDGALAMSPFREDRVELPVHATTPLDTPTLHAVGLRSRMALLLGHPPGASVPSELAAHSGSRPFSGRRVPTGLVIDPVEHAAAVASLRDNVVLVASGGGRTAFQVFDAFEVWPFRAAQPLAAEQSASVDVAGSSKFGVAGACYALSNGDTHQVRFQLISLDGRLQGVGVDIGASQRGLCTVGHDDLGFLVAWWDGAELWVRRVFVAS